MHSKFRKSQGVSTFYHQNVLIDSPNTSYQTFSYYPINKIMQRAELKVPFSGTKFHTEPDLLLKDLLL